MNYRVKRNNGVLQYPYSVVDKRTGNIVDSTVTLIGALIVIAKKQWRRS